MMAENSTREESQGHSWWRTLPGVLTGLATTLTAIAGLIVAISQLDSDDTASGSETKTVFEA